MGISKRVQIGILSFFTASLAGVSVAQARNQISAAPIDVAYMDQTPPIYSVNDGQRDAVKSRLMESPDDLGVLDKLIAIEKTAEYQKALSGYKSSLNACSLKTYVENLDIDGNLDTSGDLSLFISKDDAGRTSYQIRAVFPTVNVTGDGKPVVDSTTDPLGDVAPYKNKPELLKSRLIATLNQHAQENISKCSSAIQKQAISDKLDRVLGFVPASNPDEASSPSGSSAGSI